MLSRLTFAGILGVASLTVGPKVDGHHSSLTDARSTVQVTVDPNSVQRTISSSFFGINADGFWDSAVTSKASARALAQTAIRTVRFPGGAPADWYDWQNPYYGGRSHTSPLHFWQYVRSFGASRAVFGTNVQGHVPRATGKSYSVNSPENAAAWVAYNRSRGIRADMEVGNEEDLNLLHKADDPAYKRYISVFNAQAKAMHRTDSHVRVLGPAATNEWYWSGLDGLGMFLQGAGNRTGTGQVDAVSLHFYAGKAWSDAQSVAQYWLSSTGPWASIQRMIRDHDTRKLPVYITEWNVGGANSTSTFAPTIGHALVTVDMLGAFVTAGVAGEDYFDTHGGSTWGLLHGNGESSPLDSPTPTYYGMVLWRHMGNRLLKMTQSSDPAHTVSTYATSRKDGSLQILVINKEGSTQHVTISLHGNRARQRSLHVYSLQPVGGRVDASTVRYNGVVMPSPQTALPLPIHSASVRGNSLVYSVPGYSAVVLDLAG